MNVKEQLKIR